MTDQTISIIGCGWLGLPLATQLLAEGFKVKGSTTSTDKIGTLKEKGVEPYQLQLFPEPEGDLSTLLQADTLVINIPPKSGKLGDAFHPKQILYLTDSLRSSPIKHVIYVSSTSVYPELNRVVVEDDVIKPDQSAAPAFVEAEQLILSLAPQKVITVLRYGGLMGYDRQPGKYVAGRTVDTGNVVVNYIHRDDGVSILTTVIQKKVAGTFNVVAPEHPTREAIYRKNCADFSYELPTFVTPVEPIPYKIISPERLIQTIGYAFQYPDPLQFYYELRT